MIRVPPTSTRTATLFPYTTLFRSPDLAIPLADPDRNMGDFPTPLLPALHLAAQMLESFDEEALDMVRLKPLGFGALHLQAQLLDLGLGHGVVGQRAPLEQLRQVTLIDRAVDLTE